MDPFSKRRKSAGCNKNRIKFEKEFFFCNFSSFEKGWRKQLLKGQKIEVIGEKFNRFYSEKLPFALTNAQKRVLKEIRADLGAGFQMNRLLQGDVGSGKTVCNVDDHVDGHRQCYQASLMAPTEILATQHFETISAMVEGLGVRVAYLSGSVKGKKRQDIKPSGRGLYWYFDWHHALIEDHVVFKNMGLSIIDEQHRFGVAQRASPMAKSDQIAPHILVMTATPIPARWPCLCMATLTYRSLMNCR